MSKNLDKEQIISKIDILLESSDCGSICSHLDELQNLIKKNEKFVLKIFDELDEESKDHQFILTPCILSLSSSRHP